ncbi:hypothetical protein M1N21_02615 [Dehalococcoidia bacterium]|nr:hypothetical protein [Dehalococcoidia bacterium]
MSKTRSLKMKGLSLLVALAMAVAALPLVATPALATGDEPCPEHRIWVEPATQTVAPGDTFTVTLMQDSPAGTAGAEVGEFHFDHTLVEIVDVAMGAGYTGGMIMPPDIPGAIKEANEDGSLDAFACFFIPPGKCEPGEQEFLVITMRAKEGIVGTHTVPLTLHELYMGGPPPGYEDITPTGTDGEVVVEGPPAPMPDLVVTAVSTEWEDVGKTYTVTFTIKNEGDADAAESTASIKIDGVEKATADIPVLAAGKTHEVTTDAFTLTNDKDTIEVIADKGDVVTEGDEGNNSKTITVDKPPEGPDLIVSEVDVAWVVVGERYFVEFTIKNQGGATADPSIASIVIDGVEVVEREVRRLEAGWTDWETVGPFYYTLPGDTITVIADKCNLVAEDYEDNNSITITRGKVPPAAAEPGADLVVTHVSTEWVKEGEEYTVRFTITNQGGAPAGPSIASITIDGVEVATEACRPLAKDARVTKTVGPFTLTDPSDTVKVSADRNDDVVEASEINNCSLEVKVHAARFWGDATTEVIAEVPAAYAAISVPASLEIPAERGQLNTVAVPVEIDSNTRWQLQVRDAVGRGHMTRGDDQLEQPMKVVNANNTVCLTEGGVLHEGERSETVNSHLQQRVEFTDAAGKYTITLVFTVYPVW